jgi:hypothetical protein
MIGMEMCNALASLARAGMQNWRRAGKRVIATSLNLYRGQNCKFASKSTFALLRPAVCKTLPSWEEAR